LSKVFNPNGVGKERTRLTKSIVLAIRELSQLDIPGAESRELAAFIALALARISQTVELTVMPWEKRDYWVKADKFRLDWAWSGQYADKMKRAVLNEDWAFVAQIAALTAQKLGKVTVPPRHRLGCPWIGAWDELRNQ
jgi:hypothetical protein